VSTPPERPPLLYVLAAFGLLIGSFGGLYAASSAATLLRSRDQYIAEAKHRVEHLPGDAEKIAEKEAEVVYARRGVALPLAAMNVILSVLLFLGCGRAMRGNAWGASAWELAAFANIPYTVLWAAFNLVQAREMKAALPEIGIELTSSILGLIVIFWAGMAILYYAVCVIYLRQPNIRRLFSRPPPA
jgi:hypothetical protein